jgi:hypothetical protein
MIVIITITHCCDEETTREYAVVSDDGGEFDDEEIENEPDVQAAVDERSFHYKSVGADVDVKEIAS